MPTKLMKPPNNFWTEATQNEKRLTGVKKLRRKGAAYQKAKISKSSAVKDLRLVTEATLHYVDNPGNADKLLKRCDEYITTGRNACKELVYRESAKRDADKIADSINDDMSLLNQARTEEDAAPRLEDPFVAEARKLSADLNTLLENPHTPVRNAAVLAVSSPGTQCDWEAVKKECEVLVQDTLSLLIPSKHMHVAQRVVSELKGVNPKAASGIDSTSSLLQRLSGLSLQTHSDGITAQSDLQIKNTLRDVLKTMSLNARKVADSVVAPEEEGGNMDTAEFVITSVNVDDSSRKAAVRAAGIVHAGYASAALAYADSMNSAPSSKRLDVAIPECDKELLKKVHYLFQSPKGVGIVDAEACRVMQATGAASVNSWLAWNTTCQRFFGNAYRVARRDLVDKKTVKEPWLMLQLRQAGEIVTTRLAGHIFPSTEPDSVDAIAFLNKCVVPNAPADTVSHRCADKIPDIFGTLCCSIHGKALTDSDRCEKVANALSLALRELHTEISNALVAHSGAKATGLTDKAPALAKSLVFATTALPDSNTLADVDRNAVAATLMYSIYANMAMSFARAMTLGVRKKFIDHVGYTEPEVSREEKEVLLPLSRFLKPENEVVLKWPKLSGILEPGQFPHAIHRDSVERVKFNGTPGTIITRLEPLRTEKREYLILPWKAAMACALAAEKIRNSK